MPRYRKKPVTIDAFCLGVDPLPNWFLDKVSTNQIVLHGMYGQRNQCQIHTPEGVMTGDHGDWIIQGIQHEIYPCKPAIFQAMYEAVEDTP